jgi:hypothetical protein
MPRVTVEDVYSFPDPVIGFDFNLIIPNPPGGGNGRALNVKCKTTSLPGTSIEPVEVALHGHKRKVPGARTFPRTLPFTLLETTDFSSRDTLIRWMDKCRSAKTQAGSPTRECTTTATVEVLNAAGDVIRQVELYYAWVEELSDTDLSGDSSNAMEVSGNLSYDWFKDL